MHLAQEPGHDGCSPSDARSNPEPSTTVATQPALTVSLRNLELELGYRLFDRSVKGMTPTQAADTLYRFGVTL
ncbi:MAG: LysR family transcriptional regulator, partial [Pseudomonadota bacterium]